MGCQNFGVTRMLIQFGLKLISFFFGSLLQNQAKNIGGRVDNRCSLAEGKIERTEKKNNVNMSACLIIIQPHFNPI